MTSDAFAAHLIGEMCLMGGVYDDGRRDDDRGYPGERLDNLARTERYAAQVRADRERAERRKTPEQRQQEYNDKVREMNVWLRRNS